MSGNGFQVLLYAILPQVLPQVLGVIVVVYDSYTYQEEPWYVQWPGSS